MKKVLVLGDQICDVYEHHTATRICPEAPVPVLIPTKGQYSTSGGAGLVVAQLVGLFDDPSAVVFLPGSYSVKKRIFADDRLMLRIDSDSQNPIAPVYIFDFDFHGYDAIVVSDYDKGAFIEPTANWLIRTADDLNIPVFVDAKKNWSWYRGAFAMFPNDRESGKVGINKYAKHIIHKLGPEGCKVDGVHIPTKEHAVRDVTGAGDCFLAAFVYEWLTGNKMKLGDEEFPVYYSPGTEEKVRLQMAARFANKVAGISVEHVGTHIVTWKELDKHTDS